MLDPGPMPAAGQMPAAVEENPKVLLNNFVMRYTGTPNSKGDVTYEVQPMTNGFSCTVRLPAVAAKDGTAVVPSFSSDESETEKLAEQAAARKALDHYAYWLAANPPPPKDPSKQKKSKTKNKRSADDQWEQMGDGAESRRRLEESQLKFVEGADRADAASRKSLNNKPAWMTRGVGVNQTLFGESKGNLVKPGMYEDDLKRIEAMKGNPLGDGPDPFGEVFAERKKG